MVTTKDDIQTKKVALIFNKLLGVFRIRGEDGVAEMVGTKPTTLEARLKKLQITKAEILSKAYDYDCLPSRSWILFFNCPTSQV